MGLVRIIKIRNYDYSVIYGKPKHVAWGAGLLRPLLGLNWSHWELPGLAHAENGHYNDLLLLVVGQGAKSLDPGPGWG